MSIKKSKTIKTVLNTTVLESEQPERVGIKEKLLTEEKTYTSTIITKTNKGSGKSNPPTNPPKPPSEPNS
jgi:hypothetical protein